jgi:predicted O-methyltransferase YrrM
MACSLNEKDVARTLARLHAAADVNDPAVLAKVHAEWKEKCEVDEAAVAHLLDEAFISVSPEVGRLLYVLARASNSKSIVEFGTSFGLSTIYLACAARDNGGHVVSTELSAEKARKAGEHLAEAGVRDYVDLRVGDALQTLAELNGGADFVLLDGWKNLYLPVLKLVEPKLAQRALVVADDLDLFPEVHKPYLDYVRSQANGYVSVEVPMGDRLDVAVRVG